MTQHTLLIDADKLQDCGGVVIFDCRFSLADPSAGESDYLAGHIPGAHYLHLERDLSGPVGRHGGRHPLPAPEQFAATLARFGVGLDTRVVAYDAHRFAFASRLWWMMRALGYRAPLILDGGITAWQAAGGELESAVPQPAPCDAPAVGAYTRCCDIDGVRRQQAEGATLVDSREERRYLGLEEPIDPVAGHIPGAVNLPWQSVTGEDGKTLPVANQQARWADIPPDPVVYCGSGVTACVNLFSLALAGREDAVLYAGSWSDWCSHLDPA